MDTILSPNICWNPVISGMTTTFTDEICLEICSLRGKSNPHLLKIAKANVIFLRHIIFCFSTIWQFLLGHSQSSPEVSWFFLSKLSVSYNPFHANKKECIVTYTFFFIKNLGLRVALQFLKICPFFRSKRFSRVS